MKERRDHSSGRFVLRLGLALLSLVVLSAAATSGWIWWRSRTVGVGGAVATIAKAVTKEPEPVSVVLLGVQQAKNLHQAPLTDSILLARYAPDLGTAALLSIPRDIWVPIPGHGEGRINSVFEMTGPDGVKQAIDQLTGVRPDYYVILDYDGFKKLIDDIGGITVDVPRRLDDWHYPADDMIHFRHLVIEKGLQHMDGETALAYVRERHADPLGDLGRAQRQQQVLLAVKDQLLQPANLPKIPGVMEDLAAMIQTDFPISKAPAYAAVLADVEAGSIRSGVLDYASGAVTDWKTPGGAAVLKPNHAVITEVVNRLFAGTGLPGLPTQAEENLPPHGAPGAVGG